MSLKRSILTSLILSLSLFMGSGLWASSASVNIGQTVTITVTADGTQPFTYRWYKGAVALAGATSVSYVIQSFAATDAGAYHVIVSNAAGSTSSDTATLSLAVVLATPPTNGKTSIAKSGGNP